MTPNAEELINGLPRQTWQERSFRYWAHQQLHSDDQSTRPLWWRPLSSMVVGVISSAASVFQQLGFRQVIIRDLDRLTSLLTLDNRDRPLITVSNHESTMDDPILWGVVPWRLRWNPDFIRWTLGAKELLWMNPPMNSLFALGQTIPTVRGDGIHQLAVEIALKKLNQNKWVHVFPEAKVNQTGALVRFKWGVGRMIMESNRVPLVVPMYFTGMREVMPLKQKYPWPNPSKSTLYIKVGDSVDFTKEVEKWQRERSKLESVEGQQELDKQVRTDITERLWKEVDKLRIEYLEEYDNHCP